MIGSAVLDDAIVGPLRAGDVPGDVTRVGEEPLTTLQRPLGARVGTGEGGNTHRWAGRGHL